MMNTDVELGKKQDNAELYKAASGMALQWRELQYDVNVDNPDEPGKKMKKTLIHPMSGEVRPGEMCAIMGSSGAGYVRICS
jgi:ABC-type multidrug transport system ATPase subunit